MSEGESPREEIVELMADRYARWRQDIASDAPIPSERRGPYESSLKNGRVVMVSALAALSDAGYTVAKLEPVNWQTTAPPERVTDWRIGALWPEQLYRIGRDPEGTETQS